MPLAAFRSQRDIAVGHAVGSNLFNLMCVLGMSGIIAEFGYQGWRRHRQTGFLPT